MVIPDDFGVLPGLTIEWPRGMMNVRGFCAVTAAAIRG